MEQFLFLRPYFRIMKLNDANEEICSWASGVLIEADRKVVTSFDSCLRYLIRKDRKKGLLFIKAFIDAWVSGANVFQSVYGVSSPLAQQDIQLSNQDISALLMPVVGGAKKFREIT